MELRGNSLRLPPFQAVRRAEQVLTAAPYVGRLSAIQCHVPALAPGALPPDDGAESTPLLVLRQAIADAKVREMLVTIFNDKEHADELRANIEKLPDINKLKFKPAVYSMEVAEETASCSRR
jgi:hypothetical protein